MYLQKGNKINVRGQDIDLWLLGRWAGGKVKAQLWQCSDVWGRQACVSLVQLVFFTQKSEWWQTTFADAGFVLRLAFLFYLTLLFFQIFLQCVSRSQTGEQECWLLSEVGAVCVPRTLVYALFSFLRVMQGWFPIRLFFSDEYFIQTKWIILKWHLRAGRSSRSVTLFRRSLTYL